MECILDGVISVSLLLVEQYCAAVIPQQHLLLRAWPE